MGVYYWDTSALAKRYVTEQGSTWVLKRFSESNEANIHWVSMLVGVELLSALARRGREKNLAPQTLSILRHVIRQHLRQEYTHYPITTMVTNEAENLVLRYSLRAYDSVQLASALLLAEQLRAEGLSLTFICADKALLKAAASESLPCDDPSLHPDS